MCRICYDRPRMERGESAGESHAREHRAHGLAYVAKVSPGRTAFTLIELLVVVAIISLLVSILVPSMAKAKLLARKSMCAANLHAIGIALMMYTVENDERFPDGGYYHPLSTGKNSYTNDGKWVASLVERNYIDSNGSYPVNQINPPQDAIPTIFFCPNDMEWMDYVIRSKMGTRQGYVGYAYLGGENGNLGIKVGIGSVSNAHPDQVLMADSLYGAHDSPYLYKGNHIDQQLFGSNAMKADNSIQWNTKEYYEEHGYSYIYYSPAGNQYYYW